MRVLLLKINYYKHKLVRFFINLLYHIKFILKIGFKLNKKIRDTRIIVSLTSFPKRIDKVHWSIESMLAQKTHPDLIVLYLGKDEFENCKLPKSLTKLLKYGIIIKYVKDLKPHTKYYYAMQEYSNDILITVDDDVFYRPNLIKDLVKAYKNHSNCIICTRAHFILFDSNQNYLSYNDWDFETRRIDSESHFLLATGVGGVLYPPQLLSKETFNEEMLSLIALKNDDLWLKAMEILSNIKVFAIKSNKTKYVVGVWGSEKITLNSENVGERRNDLIWENINKEYPIKDFLISEIDGDIR